MKPLAQLGNEEGARLVGLLFDLDDTVLTHGVLTREAYDALWDLHEAGLRLVAVTGRPSGWGEVIARQWPIDGAATENGAVAVVRDGQGSSVVDPCDGAERERRRARLARSSPTWRRRRARGAARRRRRRAPLATSRGTSASASRAGRSASPTRDRSSPAARAPRARACTSTRRSTATTRRAARSACSRALRRRPGHRALSAGRSSGDSGNDAACFAAFAHHLRRRQRAQPLARAGVPPRWVAKSRRWARASRRSRAPFFDVK